MTALAFEDLRVGTRHAMATYDVTKEEVIAFAREFDPQAFHLDEEAAKKTLLGGLAASGFHTCAMTMRMTYEGFLLGSTAAGAPGIDEVRWRAPVRPGTTLSGHFNIISLRASRSRPELGLVGVEAEVFDSTGVNVMSQRYTVMFGRRDPGGPLPFAETPAAARPAPRPPLPVFEDEGINRTRFAPHFEDVVIGARVATGTRTFERDDMLRFARMYDPQPFHLNEAAAAASHFGRMSASGWLTAAVCMRFNVEARDRHRREALARGETVTANGPSPGLRDIRWVRPVFVGDTISFDSAIADKRATSRPGWGLIVNRNTGVNQNGELVYEAYGSGMWPMRA